MVDDDIPLAALAQIDDNLTLASLVGNKVAPKAAGKGQKGAPKAAPKGVAAAPKAAPKAAPVAAKGKAAPKAAGKKRPSSSSSGSSSDSSSDSGSENETPARKKAKAVKRRKAAPAERDEEDPEDQASQKVEKRNRTPKQKVVADLLCRWWYALPDWPPQDEAYYQAELEKEKLRRVPIQQWEWVPEKDERGFRKVYELSQFRGLFRTSTGELKDLRPKETCPSYKNFHKKELPELYQLLVKAYEGQLADLEKSKYNETRLKQELKATLTKTRDLAYRAKQLGSLPAR